MSTPSPFTPKHSFLEFAGSRERRRHRFAVVIGVASCLILSVPFLEFGCWRHVERAESADLLKPISAVSPPANAPVTMGMGEASRTPSPPGPSPVSNVTTQITELKSLGSRLAPEIAATPNFPRDLELKVYTVKKGDTLSDIAAAHGTTVKAIRVINDLKTYQIVVGQRLKLPAPNPPARLPDAKRSGVTNSAL